ncbi:hypothetical protein EBT16_01135 [bacterium]|nr:hypothetical protein [bacterium]
MLLAKWPIDKIMTKEFYVVGLVAEKELVFEIIEVEDNGKMYAMPLIKLFADPISADFYSKIVKKDFPKSNMKVLELDMRKLFEYDFVWGSMVEVWDVNSFGEMSFVDLIYDPTAPIH